SAGPRRPLERFRDGRCLQRQRQGLSELSLANHANMPLQTTPQSIKRHLIGAKSGTAIPILNSTRPQPSSGPVWPQPSPSAPRCPLLPPPPFCLAVVATRNATGAASALRQKADRLTGEGLHPGVRSIDQRQCQREVPRRRQIQGTIGKCPILMV